MEIKRSYFSPEFKKTLRLLQAVNIDASVFEVLLEEANRQKIINQNAKPRP